MIVYALVETIAADIECPQHDITHGMFFVGRRAEQAADFFGVGFSARPMEVDALAPRVVSGAWPWRVTLWPDAFISIHWRNVAALADPAAEPERMATNGRGGWTGVVLAASAEEAISFAKQEVRDHDVPTSGELPGGSVVLHKMAGAAGGLDPGDMPFTDIVGGKLAAKQEWGTGDIDESAKK